MTTDPCPWCGSPARLAFIATDLNRRVSAERFRYLRCETCGLLYLCPIPSRLSDYYQESYYQIPASREDLARDAEPQRFKLDILRQHLPTGRILEVGPAFGLFSSLAQQAGYQVDAVEMDSRCCRFLGETLGINAVLHSDPGDAIRTMGPYDGIILWHVIEHLPDPWKFLREAGRRLNPAGILLIATPNPSALQFDILGSHWPHVDAPRHLVLIPLPVLEKACRDCGLSLEWATTDDPGGRGWNTFGWSRAASNVPGARRLSLLTKAFGRAMTWLCRPLERLPLKGAAYTAVFRKKDAL